jgi:hypothetical protein
MTARTSAKIAAILARLKDDRGASTLETVVIAVALLAVAIAVTLAITGAVNVRLPNIR